MRFPPVRHMTSFALMVAGALILSACQAAGSGSPAASAAVSAGSGAITLTVSHTSAGDALAGPDGKTLYIRTSDTGGTSSCTGSCASTWPPLAGTTVTAGAGVTGQFGTTTRDDGSTQVTHNGQPLYYYSGDQAAGDAKGQGIGGIWFIAPVGEASASQAAGASAAPSSAGPGY